MTTAHPNGYARAMNEQTREPDDRVDFGARDVPRADKPQLVRNLFAGVADRYDTMNDIMSLRAHRLWKDAMVDWLAPRKGMRVLDLAGGTGDIALRIAERTRGGARVTIGDLTDAMLRKGQTRKELTAWKDSLDWVCADGAGLPFPDCSFDCCTIAFGLRNVADREAVLRESYRTLRIGGRFLCLEFSRPHPPLVASAYDTWSFQAIPRIGAAVARDRDAYRYLVESIRRFPDQKQLATLLSGSGFKQVSWRNLSFGIAALHSGWRL